MTKTERHFENMKVKKQKKGERNISEEEVRHLKKIIKLIVAVDILAVSLMCY